MSHTKLEEMAQVLKESTGLNMNLGADFLKRNTSALEAMRFAEAGMEEVPADGVTQPLKDAFVALLASRDDFVRKAQDFKQELKAAKRDDFVRKNGKGAS